MNYFCVLCLSDVAAVASKIQKIQPKSCTQPQSQHQFDNRLEELRIKNSSLNIPEKGVFKFMVVTRMIRMGLRTTPGQISEQHLVLRVFRPSYQLPQISIFFLMHIPSFHMLSIGGMCRIQAATAIPGTLHRVVVERRVTEMMGHGAQTQQP